MRYFWRWLLLLNCLSFGRNIASAQPTVDTLRTCKEQVSDSLKTLGRSVIAVTHKARENSNDRRIIIIEYELAQKTYEKGSQDLYIQLCVNNQFVTEVDSSVCGDLGRVKGRRGKLQIRFNRVNTGEPESIRLFGTSIEPQKPPVSKWVLNSLLRPNWGYQQIKKFNQAEKELEKQIPEKEPETGEVNETVTENSKPKKYKEKKGKVPKIIGGLLTIGTLFKLNSIKNYHTAKKAYNKGNDIIGLTHYNKANREHKIFLSLTGLAIGINLANTFSILKKGNKEMKKYRKKYPIIKRCKR